MERITASGGAGEEAATRRTFQALVDAVIPPTWHTAPGGGVELAAGAVQLCIDGFVMDDINRSHFVSANEPGPTPPLSESTAELLDRGAEQLLRSGQAAYPPLPHTGSLPPRTGLFASLSREDRLRTLQLLDRLGLPLNTLPQPYKNNPGLIQTMVNSLCQLPMFGYYSEWVGYGTTRFFSPDYRRMEFFPPGWCLAGYPGPAFGYRDCRGLLLKYPHRPKGVYLE